MSEETQRTNRKAPSMRAASSNQEHVSRADNKARSYRAETYKPRDPSKPEPQTIILNSESPKQTEKKSSSSFARLREIYNDAVGGSSQGSGIKRKQAQVSARNDLIKKGIIGLIALIAVILLIVIIVNSSKVRDVSDITVNSTATSQTLSWSGAHKGLTYEVYRAEGVNGQYMLIDTLTEGEESKTYDDLSAGTLYRYRIVAVKSNGEKTEGSAAESYTKPNAVTQTSTLTTAENSLTAIWKLVGNTADYELKYGLYENMRDAQTVSFSSASVQYDQTSGSYSYTIGGLVTDETYYMSMRTVCGNTASEWCPVFEGTVSATISTPGANPDQKMIALTFDGGPDGGNVTERILNVLSSNNARATFFQTGVNAELYPDLMRRIASEGHEVGNHTYDESHVGGDVTADDIINANTSIEAACNVSPKLFRAPQGEVTDAITNACQSAGMAIILWNFDSRDWETYDAYEIIERIETYAEDGDIIQFRNIYDETADAIDSIVPFLVEEGYQLVTVTELIQAKTGQSPVAGKIYHSAFDHE